ncbi:adenylyl-sulfate kinase [Priestia flexa]|uniref:adenylyl-sulfate kinase n=1 Tax=Priestia flexa TaxID=86664 RepID=UPI001B34280A|nr:adenylyl-sulfate kinase [Priestia flexa]
MSKSTNITWHESGIDKEARRQQNGHYSFVLWFTGLSGSGKSTVANAVAQALFEKNIRNYVLDGDNIRFGLNKNLGFSAEDRTENIRRIGEVSKLFVDSGQVVLTAFISPFKEDRTQVRELLEADEFVEVYVECPLEECEKRDPKGLYKKARSGEIRDFTGIDSPYEAPENAELVVNTFNQTVEECVETVLAYLTNKKFI